MPYQIGLGVNYDMPYQIVFMAIFTLRFLGVSSDIPCMGTISKRSAGNIDTGLLVLRLLFGVSSDMLCQSMEVVRELL